MAFSIHVVDNALQPRGELIIGDHKETFPLITTLWPADVYESQWLEALGALATGQVASCALITDIQPSEDSSGISYWAIYKEGLDVYLQVHFSRDLAKPLAQAVMAAERNIPPRVQGTPEEQSGISEWKVSFEDVRQFLIGKK